MKEIDLLINARWIIPVTGDKTILENHAVVVDADRIIAIQPKQKAQSEYTAREVLELDGHALIPGLINSHTHAAMTLFRGLADDKPLMNWLNDHIWPAEAKWVSEEFVRHGTRHAIAEMIRSGTTCFNDMYFFPDQVAEVALETGIRACVGLIMIDFPTAWADKPQTYIEKGLAVRDKYKHSAGIRTVFAPHAPYTVSDEPLTHINTLAEELDIPIHMHLHETQDEIDASIEQYKLRPIQRLEKLGLLSERLMAVHMTQLTDADIELAKRYCIHVLHCPESNLKLASGFCRVHDLQKANINIALGTDGAASNNDLDMLGEMKTAALLAKGVASDSTAVAAHEALAMATINAAKALGMETETGSLEVGKMADMVAINLDTIESQPLYDPVSQIVYACGREQVSDVWVAGKQLLKQGELTTINQDACIKESKHWRDKIKSG